MAVLNSNLPEVVRFSVFEVNLRAGELRRNGSRLKLQEQPFQILAMLLEHPGEIVTRDELRTRLWPQDTFVDFDHSLNAAVRRLRDALGDSAESPRFVETIARRGYRFIALQNGSDIGTVQPDATHRRIRRLWPALVGLAAVLAVGVVFGWHVGRSSTVHKPISEKRLTANPSDTPILGAVISPDGKYLAFADRTGFYLRQVDSGETHAVTLPKNFDAQPAAWLPDGGHLLVTWVSGPQEPPSLWEISVLGGTPRRLTDSGLAPSVSPDGSRIAFVRRSAGIPELWLMEANGEKPRKLDAIQEMCCFAPVAWSPDGKRIAYFHSVYKSGLATSQNGISTVDIATGHNETVISDARVGSALAWTSDGRLMYSMAEMRPSQNDSNLWSVPVDSQTGRATATPTRVTRDPGYVGAISISSDGKRLAVLKYAWQPDVFIADLGTKGTRLSRPRRLTLDERMDYPFSWTPDAKSVFFASDRDGTFHIYKQAIDSAVPELVAGGEEPLTTARLNPDGSMLLYLATPRLDEASNKVRLVKMPLSGGPPQQILEGPGINNQQCARLPSQLCMFSEIAPDEESFFQFDSTTGESHELPWAKIKGKDSFNLNWTLSPDGRTLAMAKEGESPTGPSIRLVSTAGNHAEKTIRVQGWTAIARLDWAADGRNLWVVAYTNRDTWGLLSVNLDGKVRTMLQEKDLMLGWAIPSPDGRRLALWEASGSTNVWMVENF